MIDEKDACEIIGLATEAGIDVWLDGGWGIDTLVGRQTRPTTTSTFSSGARTPGAS